jgi:hypothetical protein
MFHYKHGMDQWGIRKYSPFFVAQNIQNRPADDYPGLPLNRNRISFKAFLRFQGTFDMDKFG